MRSRHRHGNNCWLTTGYGGTACKYSQFVHTFTIHHKPDRSVLGDGWVCVCARARDTAEQTYNVQLSITFERVIVYFDTDQFNSCRCFSDGVFFFLLEYAENIPTRSVEYPRAHFN